LQQYFNQHIFKLEQEEYTREKVPWDSIAFVDNQECLDLIEKKPLCLLSMLDEECKFPSGTDASWLGKLHQTLEKHKFYVKPRLSRTAFGVLHYAGEVMYETPSFLEKNRDTLYDELVELVQGSSVEFIAGLFPPGNFMLLSHLICYLHTRIDQNSAAKRTVSTQFKEELNNLMKTLSETSPHYVRCIKPNTEKKPKIFDDKLVLGIVLFFYMLFLFFDVFDRPTAIQRNAGYHQD
jgi:myosin heavy subunit